MSLKANNLWHDEPTWRATMQRLRARMPQCQPGSRTFVQQALTTLEHAGFPRRPKLSARLFALCLLSGDYDDPKQVGPAALLALAKVLGQEPEDVQALLQKAAPPALPPPADAGGLSGLTGLATPPLNGAPLVPTGVKFPWKLALGSIAALAGLWWWLVYEPEPEAQSPQPRKVKRRKPTFVRVVS